LNEVLLQIADRVKKSSRYWGLGGKIQKVSNSKVNGFFYKEDHHERSADIGRGERGLLGYKDP
jgi:hypothetical protein